MTVDFFSEILKPERSGIIFSITEIKEMSTLNSKYGEIIFQEWIRNRHSHTKRKWREFVISRSTLKEWLKKVLETKNKELGNLEKE